MNCVWRERQNPLTLGALRPFDQAINNKEAPQRTLWSVTERVMREHPEDVFRPFDQAINNKEAPQRTLWSVTERVMREDPEDVLVTRLPSRR